MASISSISSADSSSLNKHRSWRHRKYPLVSEISKMSDEDILNASVKNATKKANNSKAARTLKNGSYIVLAALPIVEGILKKGSLSTKAAATLASAACVTITAATVGGALDLTKRVEAKSDRAKEFGKKHPVLKTMGEVTGAVAAAAFALKGGSMLIKKASNVFSPACETLKTQMGEAAKRINGSKIGKHTENIQKIASDFASSHPNISNAARKALIWTPLAAYVGVSSKAASTCAKISVDETNKNANKLYLLRELAQASIDSEKDNFFSQKEDNAEKIEV